MTDPDPQLAAPYRTLAQPAQAETVVERSRFIAMARPVDDVDAALEHVEAVRAAYHDARHVVFGLRVGRGPQLVDRFNDDGEPARTAGYPIWQLLEGEALTNALVVVVRYFGGIKLGTGGLARAYRDVARRVIEAAGVVERHPQRALSVAVPYNLHGQIEHALGELDGVRVVDTDWAADVTLHLSINARDLDRVRERLAAILQCDPDDVGG